MARAQSADSFALDLLTAGAGAVVGAGAVLSASARAMKKEAQENVLKSAPTHNAGAHRAINYDDPSAAGFLVSTEVGYDKSIRGGSLGNLLEYGGGGDKSPAHRDLGRAADSVEATIGRAMQVMAVRLL